MGPYPFEKSVFINCPFDAAYHENLDALILGILASGLGPRCALESSPGDPRPRLKRIDDLLSESKYSVHDLSRLRGEGVANLARMNMPFELGMARGLWLNDSRRQQFIFVDEPHLLSQATSDLAGLDPVSYGSDAADLLRRVLGSLIMAPDATTYPEPEPDQVVSLLPAAHAATASIRRQYGAPIWKRMVQAIDRIVRDGL